MIQRDYLLRQMEVFFKALDERFRGKNKNEYEDISVILNEFYSTYFHIDREKITGEGEQIISHCILYEPVEKAEMLSELIFKDAVFTVDTRRKNYLFRLVLKLYDSIECRSKTYSSQREKKRREITDFLSGN
ncbi:MULTISPECIES: hypothetical protein [Sanguibacteroides]|uniref:Uncharacterized protein n=1 Tax=Sanguibacteroides justesenii TaxID=1547597 RepID=A0A0C3NHC7_9PORP|nr:MULTISPECIES: hypothetical protein [Sanguibacteroides]KIO43364.1 hypothetical protein IE90_09440 [Sanguibacteroides justesenii]KIO45542.1 hypothetical protein BA92_03470 [Sanguibacteroides justesenii]PXZ45362.1 hypothetical protein DMB45_02805 [Sanguibacteroides justesenii]